MGYIQTILEFALQREDLREELLRYIKELTIETTEV